MDEPPLNSFRKLVLGAGIYNILSGLPLALPFLAPVYYASVNSLNRVLGLGGAEMAVPTQSVNRLFVNSSGMLLCLVGALLIYASRNLPDRAGIPCLNAFGRIAFAALVFYYCGVGDLARALISFALVDLAIAAGFLYFVRRMRSQA